MPCLRIGLATLAIASCAVAPRAAPAPDPAVLVRQIAGDLDLQTKLPGEKPDIPTPLSGFKLRIPGAATIMWVAVAVGLAFALFALRDLVPALSRRSRTRIGEVAADAQTVEAAERMVQAGDDADDLAALGRTAEAMHLLLLRSLVELRRRLGITLADSLTSREILQKLTLPGEGRQALADLIRRVELATFGARTTAPADYAACRASYERLIAAMLESPASAAAGA